MNAKTIAYICNHKDGHVKLFMEAPASPMWEVSELVLRHEAETQIDVLKAENAELHAECDRLTALLQWEQGHRERIGTHGDECWKWGPAYYECALAEIERLTAMLAPQKPMSAEEVTKPGWYWVRNTRCPYWKLRYVAPALGKGGTVVGFQFVGPLKAPEV